LKSSEPNITIAKLAVRILNALHCPSSAGAAK
jgi:hypothetical protein